MEITGLSLKKFKKVLIVGSVVFPILVTVILMHRKSILDVVEAFSQINALGGRAKNATTNILKGDAASAGEGKVGTLQNQRQVRPCYNLFLSFTAFLCWIMSLIRHSRLHCLMSVIINLFNLYVEDKLRREKKLKIICNPRGILLFQCYFVFLLPISFFSYVLACHFCHAPNYRHVTDVGSHYKMTSYKPDSQTIQESNNSNRQFITPMKIWKNFLCFLDSKA